MCLRQICWELFRHSGQVGYYLLCCQLREEAREEIEETGGTGSEIALPRAAQPRL